MGLCQLIGFTTGLWVVVIKSFKLSVSVDLALGLGSISQTACVWGAKWKKNHSLNPLVFSIVSIFLSWVQCPKVQFRVQTLKKIKPLGFDMGQGRALEINLFLK